MEPRLLLSQRRSLTKSFQRWSCSDATTDLGSAMRPTHTSRRLVSCDNLVHGHGKCCPS